MDPIANMLTKIRNAQKAHRDAIKVPHSKIKEKIAQILKQEGFVKEVSMAKNEKMPQIKIALKENRTVNLKCISKPGQRIYIKGNEIKPVRNGLGISIISTSKGIMTNKQARKEKIGGELLCKIY